jgi:hypothetical protein
MTAEEFLAASCELREETSGKYVPGTIDAFLVGYLSNKLSPEDRAMAIRSAREVYING